MSLILQALQGANWQRAGGRGNPPRRVERPDDRPPAVRSTDELHKRRQAQDRELKRRAQRKKTHVG